MVMTSVTSPTGRSTLTGEMLSIIQDVAACTAPATLITPSDRDRVRRWACQAALLSLASDDWAPPRGLTEPSGWDAALAAARASLAADAAAVHEAAGAPVWWGGKQQARFVDVTVKELIAVLAHATADFRPDDEADARAVARIALSDTAATTPFEDAYTTQKEALARAVAHLRAGLEAAADWDADQEVTLVHLPATELFGRALVVADRGEGHEWWSDDFVATGPFVASYLAIHCRARRLGPVASGVDRRTAASTARTLIDELSDRDLAATVNALLR